MPTSAHHTHACSNPPCASTNTRRPESKTTRAVPFFNILWAELSAFDITVHHAHPYSKHAVRVAYINYTLEKTDRAFAHAWLERLLERAYGASQRRKRIKVLVNPFGGQGAAQKRYIRDVEPIFAAARCELDVERTHHSGHAVEIAEELDVDAWDVVACCSGDGVPHEVFNGLGRKPDAARALARVAVAQLPCGTGNAMSLNLNGTDSPSLAALCVVKGLRTPMDLVSVTQGDRRTLSFLSQAVGIVAESDLGTENLRWMGSARFTYGFLVRLLGKTVYPCDIAVNVEIDGKAAIRESCRRYRDTGGNSSSGAAARTPRPRPERSNTPQPTGLPPLRFGSVTSPLPPSWSLIPYANLGNFYAGNMAYVAASTPFFPASLPADGCLDLVCIDGDIPRLTALRSLLAVEKGTFFDMPHVGYRKVSAYRIVPRAPPDGRREGYVSVDGERVPFEPFQAEVHRGLGTVLSRSGRLWEAEGV